MTRVNGIDRLFPTRLSLSGPSSARLSLLATACCGLLSLTACSGTDTPGADTPGAAKTAGSRPSGSVPQATRDKNSSAVPAAELCGYLRGRLPTLKAIGSETGAMANLTVNLYSWYEKQGAVPNGGQIDEQIKQECPEVGAEILKISGMRSFATL